MSTLQRYKMPDYVPPALQPFASRNFRLYLGGYWVSKAGTSAYRLALAWTVLHLPTGNSFAVGVVVAVNFVPSVILGPWAGGLADRYSKRTIIMYTEGALMVVTAAVTILAFTGRLTLWPLLSLAVLGGVVAAVDLPAQASLVSELVPKGQVRHTIAILSIAGNIATVAGPLIAGVALALDATAWVFFANAVSFLVVVVAVSRMRLATTHGVSRDKTETLAAGWRHLGRNKDLLLLICLMTTVGALASNFQVTAVLAANSAGLPASAAAHSIAFFAAGALTGGALVMMLRKAGERVILAASIGFALFYFVGGLIAPSALAFVAVPLGVGWVILLTSMNTKLQASTDDRLRGRVMSIYVLANCVSGAAGALVIGWLSGAVGPNVAMVMEGALCLVGATAVAVVLAVGRRRDGFQRVRAV